MQELWGRTNSLALRTLALAGQTVFNALITVLAARRLDASELAVFGFGYSSLAIGSALADFGTSYAQMRAVARRGQQGPHPSIGWVFVVLRGATTTVASASLIFVGAAVAYWRHDRSLWLLLCLAAAVVAVRSVTQYFQAWAQGMSRWGRDAVLCIMPPALALVLAWKSPGVTTALRFFACLGAASVVTNLGYWSVAHLRRRSVSMEPGFKHADLWHQWRFAWPIGLAGTTFFVAPWCEYLVLLRWCDAPVVAEYFLATAVISVMRLGLSPFESVTYVAIARAAAEGPRPLQIAEQRLAGGLALVVGLIVAGAALGGKTAIEVLYGRNHAGAATYFLMLLPSVFVRMSTVSTTVTLSGGRGDSRPLRNGQLLVMTVRIAGTLVLVPRLGVLGVILAITVGQILGFVYLTLGTEVDPRVVLPPTVRSAAAVAGPYVSAWLMTSAHPVAPAVLAAALFLLIMGGEMTTHLGTASGLLPGTSNSEPADTGPRSA